MPKGMQAIYTQTVGAGNATTVTFNNIPQTYTDLQVLISPRISSSYVQTGFYIYLNGSTATNYSTTYFQGSGSAVGSSRETNNVACFLGQAPAANATANTFGNVSIYIPNYTSGLFKQIVTDVVQEHNASGAYQDLTANMARINSPITSISFNTFGYGDFVQNSTFTLYGISR